MNMLISALGFLLIANAEGDSQRTIGAVLAGAGLNDMLREREGRKGVVS